MFSIMTFSFISYIGHRNGGEERSGFHGVDFVFGDFFDIGFVSVSSLLYFASRKIRALCVFYQKKGCVCYA